MRCLIYQYWIGDMPAYARASREALEAYARTIGADYRFDHNPKFFRGKYANFYTALRPVFDRDFHSYDRVLFADMDVIPVAGLSENIFDQPVGHLAMVEEVEQPALREGMDPTRGGKICAAREHRWARTIKRVWGITAPRDALGRPRVFNSGVVLYSAEGLRALRRCLPRPATYRFVIHAARLPLFYKLDQNYLGAFIGHPDIAFSALPRRWNAQVISLHNAHGPSTLLDERAADSCMIHVQHQGRNKMTQADMVAVQHGQFDFTAP